MTDEELEQALREMRADEPAPSPDLGVHRADVVDAMVRAAQPQPRRRWPVAVLAAALVALVAAVAVAFVPHRHPGSPGSTPSLAPEAVLLAGDVVLIRAGALTPLGKSPVSVGLGDQVGTMAEGRAAVRLDGQAVATLAPRSQLVVATDGCEVRAGSVAFEVPKRPPGSTFVVHAGDVDVVVRGTSFRVSAEPGATARVEVTEGVVSILEKGRGEVATLRAGDRWPAGASAPAPTASAVDSAVPAGATSGAARGAGPVDAPPSSDGPAAGSARGAVDGARPPRGSASAGGAPVSDLAEQNRLLLQAAEARARGDASEEQRALDRYLKRFPDGQGAHDALAGRMRSAASRGDPVAARSAAASYLARYPDGPLRDEARAILAKKP